MENNENKLLGITTNNDLGKIIIDWFTKCSDGYIYIYWEQDASHPHFTFSCNLCKVTLDYFSELINLNYSFVIPFKFGFF